MFQRTMAVIICPCPGRAAAVASCAPWLRAQEGRPVEDFADPKRGEPRGVELDESLPEVIARKRRRSQCPSSAAAVKSASIVASPPSGSAPIALFLGYAVTNPAGMLARTGSGPSIRPRSPGSRGQTQSMAAMPVAGPRVFRRWRCRLRDAGAIERRAARAAGHAPGRAGSGNPAAPRAARSCSDWASRPNRGSPHRACLILACRGSASNVSEFYANLVGRSCFSLPFVTQ